MALCNSWDKPKWSRDPSTDCPMTTEKWSTESDEVLNYLGPENFTISVYSHDLIALVLSRYFMCNAIGHCFYVCTSLVCLASSHFDGHWIATSASLIEVHNWSQRQLFYQSRTMRARAHANQSSKQSISA